MSDLKGLRDAIDPGMGSDQIQSSEPSQIINNLEELLDKFGLALDDVNLLNKYLYKGTDCGASISIQTPDHEWHHNGEDWTGITEAIAFTIQTIVEGSDSTVDSEPFVLPVEAKKIDDWLEYMEQQARVLWEAANHEHYYLRADGETIGILMLTWDGAEIDLWNEETSIPTEELKALSIDECVQNDYPETVELPPINGVAYSLQKYQPECY
jgi:hypothetical protein